VQSGQSGINAPKTYMDNRGQNRIRGIILWISSVIVASIGGVLEIAAIRTLDYHDSYILYVSLAISIILFMFSSYFICNRIAWRMIFSFLSVIAVLFLWIIISLVDLLLFGFLPGVF